MNDRDMMQLHVDALFTRDVNGDSVRLNEPGGTPAPRFFIGLTRHGALHRFRYDLDLATRGELETALHEGRLDVCRSDEPLDGSRYAPILARIAPIASIWSGPAFAFPADIAAGTGVVRITEDDAQLLKRHFEAWISDVPRCQPMFGLAVNGAAVALCCSVRRTALADEAGVETILAFRGKGYACLVTAAWARAVRECGRIPLYSTSWSNFASRAVARRLELVLLGSDLHIT
jgi:hypothetical protein